VENAEDPDDFSFDPVPQLVVAHDDATDTFLEKALDTPAHPGHFKKASRRLEQRVDGSLGRALAAWGEKRIEPLEVILGACRPDDLHQPFLGNGFGIGFPAMRLSI
jgi:hypothetical protein